MTLTRIGAALSIIGAIFLTTVPALAQKLPSAVIAVIDSQRVWRDSKAATSARQQLEQFRGQFQQEIQREEERLRNEEQELGRQRAILAPDAFEGRRREFERKVQDLQRRVQERQRALEQSFNVTRGEINKVVIAVINDLSKDRGFTVVLDRAQVSFSADGLDITADVLRVLDQRIPQVKVQAPKG
jgi:outer membrane protein